MPGNISTSKLLSGARQTRNKQLAYNDQAAAFDWQNSEQTEAEFNAYQSYLKKRQSQTPDPSKALSIQSKMRSAQTSFTSNEIQRQSMAVAYGEISNQEKMARMGQLLRAAYETGNMNQVQNIQSQMASLDKTIQSEARGAMDRAVADGERAARANTKAYNDGLNMQLRMNKVAFDAMEKAQNQQDVIRDEKGNPVKGRIITDAEGGIKIELDENGSEIRPTARQIQQAKAIRYMNEEKLLMSAIDAGMDESGTRLAALTSMQSSDDYKKATSPGLLGALNIKGGGENPFTNKYDPVTRTFNSTTRDVIGQNPDGTNVYRTGFETKDEAKLNEEAPKTLNFDRRTGLSPTGAMDNFEMPTYKGDEYNRMLQLDILGKDGKPKRVQGFVGTNNDSILTPGRIGTIPHSKEDERAGRYRIENGKMVTPGKAAEFVDALGHLEIPDYIGKPAETFGQFGQGVKDIAGGLTNTATKIADNPLGRIVAGAQLTQQRNKDRAAKQAADWEAARKHIEATAAAAALAAKPVQAPGAKVAYYNPATKTMANVQGAPKLAPAVVKATKTVGTPQFTQSLYPKVTLPGSGFKDAKPTPAPVKKKSKFDFFNPKTWFMK